VRCSVCWFGSFAQILPAEPEPDRVGLLEGEIIALQPQLAARLKQQERAVVLTSPMDPKPDGLIFPHALPVTPHENAQDGQEAMPNPEASPVLSRRAAKLLESVEASGLEGLAHCEALRVCRRRTELLAEARDELLAHGLLRVAPDADPERGERLFATM
jgi:hypothetical protein